MPNPVLLRVDEQGPTLPAAWPQHTFSPAVSAVETQRGHFPHRSIYSFTISLLSCLLLSVPFWWCKGGQRSLPPEPNHIGKQAYVQLIMMQDNGAVFTSVSKKLRRGSSCLTAGAKCEEVEASESLKAVWPWTGSPVSLVSLSSSVLCVVNASLRGNAVRTHEWHRAHCPVPSAHQG